MPRKKTTSSALPLRNQTNTKRFSFFDESSDIESPDAETDRTDNSSNPRTFERNEVTPQNTGKQQLSETPDEIPRRRFIPQNASNTSEVDPQLAARKNVRKQNNPTKREQMMWNQINEIQNRTDNIIPKAPFGRLIRELLIEHSSGATRITLKALEALQISSEMYLTQFFADAYACTLHRGRITLGVHDIRLVRFLRGPSDAGNVH